MKTAIMLFTIVLSSLLLCGCESKNKNPETVPTRDQTVIETTDGNTGNTEVPEIETTVAKTKETISYELDATENEEATVVTTEAENIQYTERTETEPTEGQLVEEVTTESTKHSEQEGSMSPEDEF